MITDEIDEMSGPSRRRHIVLVGEMKSGKTTIGWALAGRLARKFLDSDETIQSQTETTGAAIAERHGVAWLHNLELSALLEALDSEHPSVIAAAASTIDSELARERLADHDVFWLDGRHPASEEESSHRRKVSLEEAELLYVSRRPLYAAVAVLRVDTSELTVSQCVDSIVFHLRDS